MKQLMENELINVIGGGGYDGDLPVYTPTPSTAYIEAILALLAPSRTVHPAD
jgi:hypothetical protein